MHQTDTHSLERPVQQTEMPSIALDVDLTSTSNQKLLSEMSQNSKELPEEFGCFELATGDGGRYTGGGESNKQPEADGRPPREQPSFDDRMKNFNERVYRGVADGSIKQSEYGHLNRHLDDLADSYEQMKKGGFTEAEKAELSRKMEMQNLRIFRDRHDSDKPLPPDHQKVDRTDIEERLKRQQARLGKGDEDGSLTESESKRLAGQIEKIAKAYERAKCGGLSDKEQDRLVERLDLQGLKIFRNRHDNAIQSCEETMAKG